MEWWAAEAFFTSIEDNKKWSLKVAFTEWFENLHKIGSISNITLFDQSDEEYFLLFAERLEHYEIELSNVIIVGDPSYMTLTVEKRYLIRELHTLLLEIEEAL